MFTINDFVKKFENYTTEELYEAFINIEQYSAEGKEALEIVINNQGGITSLEKIISEKKKVDDEIKRIQLETIQLSSKETNSDFIKSLVTSELLTKEQVDEIIDEQFSTFQVQVKDQAIDSKTVIKAVFSGFIATITGGIYMWFVLSNSSRVPIFFFIGLAIICYLIIRLITQKTKSNNVVFIATFISILLSAIIGYCLASLFGRPF